MALLNDFHIQLYSLNDIIENDFAGIMEKLGKKGMGYSGVEFAEFYGISSENMKKILEANELRPLASHTPYDRLINAIDEEIEYQQKIGIEYIICPYAEMKIRADALEVARNLSPAAEKIIAAGLKFGYHNHAHEFVKDGSEYLLDILFDNLPPESVMELDIYWSEYADVDSLAYIEKNKARLELLHVKQIGKNKENAELDKGLLDFKDIISKAKNMGVKHFILEQEEYEVSSLQSAENAIRYIKSL